jgi:hypothetical protein
LKKLENLENANLIATNLANSQDQQQSVMRILKMQKMPLRSIIRLSWMNECLLLSTILINQWLANCKKLEVEFQGRVKPSGLVTEDDGWNDRLGDNNCKQLINSKPLQRKLLTLFLNY